MLFISQDLYKFSSTTLALLTFVSLEMVTFDNTRHADGQIPSKHANLSHLHAWAVNPSELNKNIYRVSIIVL